MISRTKGVKRVRSKGRVYYYHRKTMKRLPGVPGSAEFDARRHQLERSRVGALPKQLKALILAYRQSPEFVALAPMTKVDYLAVFDRLKPNQHVPLTGMDSRFIYKLRDKIAAERGTRSLANKTVKVLRLMFNWGIKRGHAEINPALLVEAIKRPRTAPEKNRPWMPTELRIVLREAPAWLRVPIALAAFAGLRESDVARITWTAYDGQYIRGRSQKTGEFVWMPAHYRLREILDAAPRTSPNIVLGARGKPMAATVLRSNFFRLNRRLVKDGLVGPGLSMHGLRHTLGSDIVELGGTNEEGAAVLGHASTQTTAHYSRNASRKILATRAIERLEERDRNEERKTSGKTSQ